MADYFVLDVETANSDMASICQIGFVAVEGNKIIDRFVSLLDPEDYFAPINQGIHGISADKVKGSPTFPALLAQITPVLQNQIVVTHGPFDGCAIEKAALKYGVSAPIITWLNNMTIIRRTWPEFSKRGYGLADLAKHFKIEHDHHDALSDAITAAEILHRALEASAYSVVDWMGCKYTPAPKTQSEKRTKTKPITQTLETQFDCTGEFLVFTGELSRMTRKEATEFATKAGITVEKDVTKRTTMLCVGLQDHERLAGHDRSSKHRKAEERCATGQRIRIINEEDLMFLIEEQIASTA